MASYERDPVSILLDRGAREMLARVYAARRGEWVMTRLADPTDRHRRWAAAHGWDLDGPDNAPTLSRKRLDAHTRWGRAYMRALWYNHRHYGQGAGRRPGEIRSEMRMAPNGSPLQVEWGRRLPGSSTGRVLPAGRAVRIRVPYGGGTARRVVDRKTWVDRTWVGDHEQGGRFSIAADRDWA